jgi:Domain of unknown function (DUF4124)
MTMLRTLPALIALSAALVAGNAHAQIKCWNEGGKRVCGDAPPAGAKVTNLKASSGPADAAPAPAAKDGAKDAKAAKAGPLTPAEREQEFRKRQMDSQKAAEKQAAAQKDADAKRENCERAREALRTLETGRVMRTDAKGERYFLDDAQVAQETAKARQIVKDSCN